MTSIEKLMLSDHQSQRRISPKRRVLPLLLLLGFLPMLVVTPAPLADWASHLARVAVTDRVLNGDPFWSDRYHFQGFFIPNAVLDVVVLGLMRLGLTVDQAGIVFLALCYGSFVMGFVQLSKVGSVPNNVAVSVATMLFYTGNIMYSLVNYMTGVGLAMLASSYCLKPELRLHQRFIVAVLTVPVIAFCHIVAAGIFVAIYSAIALFRPLSAPFGWASMVRRKAVLQAPALVSSVICAVVFLLSPAGGDKMTLEWLGQPSLKGIIFGKVKMAAEGLSSGFELADGMFAFMIAVISLGLWRNRAKIEQWMLWVVVAIALMPLLAPFIVGAGQLLDARLFIVTLSVALAILPWADGLHSELQQGVVLFCATRIILISFLWFSYRPIYHQIEVEFATLPMGSTLLSAYTDVPGFYKDRAPPLHEIAAIAVRDGVFVPSMWAEASQQPLVINPERRPLWLWSHSANGRTPENLSSVRALAKRYCSIDPHTHLFLLHVTRTPQFSIESSCQEE